MGAEEFIPAGAGLEELRRAAQSCRGCPLYQHATQVVFGHGSEAPAVVLVGEQPGDHEDREGVPFVGPSGALLDRALAQAGIDRRLCYVTNAVKHFKWEARGTRRLHKKPSSREVAACRPWLESELDRLQPQLVVCLGATAAQSLLGPAFRVTRDRGRILPWAGRSVLATVHPSSVLRGRAQDREVEFQHLVADLKVAAPLVGRT